MCKIYLTFQTSCAIVKTQKMEVSRLTKKRKTIWGLVIAAIFVLIAMIVVAPKDSSVNNAMLICAVILGLLLVAIFVVGMHKEIMELSDYDERQIAMQGKAYKYGFWVASIFNTAAVLADDVLGKYVEIRVLLMAGILLGFAVMLSYAILHDAYFRAYEKKSWFTVGKLTTLVMDARVAYTAWQRGNVIVDGVVTFEGVADLLMCIFLTYIVVIVMIKGLMERKEKKDEEPEIEIRPGAF